MNRPTSVLFSSTVVLRWCWLRWPERGAELLIPLLLRGVVGALAFAFALAGAGSLAAMAFGALAASLAALAVGHCLWGEGLGSLERGVGFFKSVNCRRQKAIPEYRGGVGMGYLRA
jgi:hypothetical protein